MYYDINPLAKCPGIICQPLATRSLRMKSFAGSKYLEILLLLGLIPLLYVGCESPPVPTTETTNGIHRSLDNAGYDDVKVTTGKGGVTLTGTVASEGDKANVWSLAKAKAGPILVSNEIAVRPPVNTIEAKLVTQINDENSNYHVVRVFYATDRKQSSANPPIVDYGGERAGDDALR